MNFKDKVIYQIYPKSFYDANNDGVGDIAGIIQKLDYLKHLGVDYIWINPIYKSPQNDNGYDIEDYYDIDPTFGTMEELEELIKEAGKRDIYLMMDMVLNHTSTNHEWFQKAVAGNQEYRDYYLFNKGNNGNPPTNWESKFKGSAWKYVEELDEYYLHLFHETQADLNWKNDKVREEAAKIVDFWINKGVKGFRFDVINLIDKQKFEDDLDGDGRCFYTDGPLVHTYLKELNQKTYGRYQDIITVGELSSTSIENCVQYTAKDNHELTMGFNFHHLKVDYCKEDRWKIEKFNFRELKDMLNQWQIGLQEGNAWSALFWCCHDQPRVLSRYGDDKKYPVESAKMLATVIHMLRGTPYIYQGEEIGMTNAYFEQLDKYRDIDALNCYNEMKKIGKSEDEIFKFLKSRSRDNARTPMQWNDQKYAGFSEVEPWINVIDNYRDINVENSVNEPNSVFNYYRQLIKLRKEIKVIQDGLYVPLLLEHDSVFAFKRVLDNEEIIVYNNFYANRASININSGQYEVLLSNINRTEIRDTLVLQPYESLVLKKINY